MKRVFILALCCLTVVISCKKLEPKAPAEDELLDGPVEGLTYEQQQQFLRGDIAFNDDVFTKETGLGPIFVAASCGSCHAGDGKGHPFTTLTRFGQWDSTGNHFLHLGGPQLQNRALPGFNPELIPAGAPHSNFTPPANTGLGFIDAVADDDIMKLSDPNDKDGDGISGVPCWINPKEYIATRENTIFNNGKYIGRFGKKAGAYNLTQQTAGAYNQDMGITSTYEPYDTYSGEEIDPEVSNQTLLDVVFYLKTLKAPIQRNQGDADVAEGKQLFTSIDCSKCHTPQMKTGASSIEALAYKTFYPYTDLLLHDMGAGLDDGYTEGSATTAEWKTPPLWGLGLSKNSQGGNYFLLHDGRAHSIEQAIEMHGGEAAKSVNKYNALSESQKTKLIKFLESL
jgi:CxxC motif-containing protein (DUF1111 family)